MRQNIELSSLKVNGTSLWDKQWLLLCSGDYDKADFNAMTIAWGSLGVMWHKPFVQVVVRPGRYTYEFMEKYPDFTLSVLPDSMRKSMSLMGSLSGRDTDKISDAGLTPIPSETVKSPAFKEAELLLECKTMYRDTMNPEFFMDPVLDEKYPQKDYHIIYFGEILKAEGISKYQS